MTDQPDPRLYALQDAMLHAAAAASAGSRMRHEMVGVAMWMFMTSAKPTDGSQRRMVEDLLAQTNSLIADRIHVDDLRMVRNKLEKFLDQMIDGPDPVAANPAEAA